MTPGRRTTSPGTSRVTTVVVALAALVTTACAEPDTEPTPGPGDAPAEEQDPIHEPAPEQLRDAIAELHETLTVIEDHLEIASQAEDLDQAHAAADDALRLLLADRSQTSTTGLLPSQTTHRSASGSPDLLNVTVNLAQESGGQLGRRLAELMRDPIAGDLGAWQRDAAGMAELAEQAGTGQTNIASLENRILDLDGEGPRAVAWAYAVGDLDDLALAREAAERGLAHLQIMLAAVDELATQGEEVNDE